MKKVLFNLERTQPTPTVKRHGGGIYGEIVFRRILQKGYPVEALFDSSRWLNPDIRELCEKHGVKLHDLASGMSVQQIIDENHIDVFYTPLLVTELASLKNVDIVCTIHGLRDLELPVDWFSLRYPFNLKGYIKQAVFMLIPKWFRNRKRKQFQVYIDNDNVRFVTVSEQSRSSIRLFFPAQRDRDIRVYYSANTATGEPTPGNIRPGQKYFLMVSGNRWEKNNLRAIIALDRLYSDGIIADTKTIVTGVKNPKAFRYRLKNPDKFEFPGYVDDAELTALYRDAYCFIYPTLNEGFGYPPLEAMRFSTPVLASPVTSVAEVCGDGVVYFNPYDILEMQLRVLRIMEPEFHAEMAARGHERYLKVKARQDADLDSLIDYIYQ